MTRTYCPTCGYHAAKPFRRYVSGDTVLDGCVDEFHSEAMAQVCNSSSAWHFRPEAQRIRTEIAEWQRRSIHSLWFGRAK